MGFWRDFLDSIENDEAYAVTKATKNMTPEEFYKSLEFKEISKEEYKKLSRKEKKQYKINRRIAVRYSSYRDEVIDEEKERRNADLTRAKMLVDAKNKKKRRQRLSQQEFLNVCIGGVIVITILNAIFSFTAEKVYDYIWELNFPETYTLDEFKELVSEGKVSCIYPPETDSSWTLYFAIASESTANFTQEDFEDYDFSKDEWGVTTFLNTDEFRTYLADSHIPVIARTFASKSSTITTVGDVLYSGFALVVLIAMISMVMSMTNGSSDSSGIEVYTRDKCIDVTFADVVGHDEVIKDLEIIRSMFVDNRIGSTLNCDIPKGILLTGAPGTGKTLLAKAMACEMSVNFIYANASSFIELYVGMGAKRVRKLFRMARRYEPCVLFIDEIDAIGMSRDSTAGGNSEQRQAITALLQELDGFTHLGKILVVAATNDANCLDPALTRAGRFDRRIEVTPPKDWHVRLKLLELYTKDKQLDETVDLENIAKTITGFTGSDVKTLVNEAVLNTIADKRLAISADDFQIAIEKKMFHGNRRNEKAIEHDRRICAYHEAGHAIVTYLTKLPIVQVSIVQSTSGVGGYVMHEDLETTLYSKAEIEGRIHVAYGGRCAEQLHFGEGAVTVGASNDIKQATGLLTKYICEYGFDTETGCVVSDAKDESVKERIKVLAKKFESETFEMLSKYQEAHEAFANYLFDAEILSGAETEEFLAKYINLEEV